MPAPEPETPSLPRDAVWETGLSLLGLFACYLFGHITGWMGRPKTLDSTVFWPFYTDTWFPSVVLTGRVVLPILALALVWPFLRRWVKEDPDSPLPLLCGLVACAWVVHLCLGFVRHGVEAGLTFSFRRPQEYWNDAQAVKAGFLAAFPEIGRPLAQHSATHPPGIILLLAGVRALGFTSGVDAELVCTPIAAVTAFPLWGAAKRLTDEKTARMAVPLFLFACSVSAFAVLCMDIVTMFLGALALYGFARSLEGDSWGGVVLGVAMGMATLCSFLVFTIPLSFLVILWSRRGWQDRRVVRALLIAVIAFVSFYLFLAVVFGYRPFHVFASCFSALAGNEAERRSRFRGLLRGPLTFWGSLGLALAGLTVRSTFATFRRLARREKLDPAGTLILASTLPWLVPVLTGTPRAEVEHIFLMFVPLTALGAASAARRWYERDPGWVANLAVPLAIAQSIAIEVLAETYW